MKEGMFYGTFHQGDLHSAAAAADQVRAPGFG